jgi:hyperosmotically inducible protein
MNHPGIPCFTATPSSVSFVNSYSVEEYRSHAFNLRRSLYGPASFGRVGLSRNTARAEIWIYLFAVERRTKVRLGKYLSAMGATLFLGASLLAGVPQNQQPAPDNTKNNQGDASKDAKTADQQKMNPADRTTTKQIRKSVMQDKSLSTYAHNIKIITQDGKVTLKGPVRSDDEKANLEAKAVAVAGAGNVSNQLEIAPKQ